MLYLTQSPIDIFFSNYLEITQHLIIDLVWIPFINLLIRHSNHFNTHFGRAHLALCITMSLNPTTSTEYNTNMEPNHSRLRLAIWSYAFGGGIFRSRADHVLISWYFFTKSVDIHSLSLFSSLVQTLLIFPFSGRSRAN